MPATECSDVHWQRAVMVCRIFFLGGLDTAISGSLTKKLWCTEEAELEELMQKRSLLPLDVLLHGDPETVNTESVFGVSCSACSVHRIASNSFGSVCSPPFPGTEW